MGREMLPKEEYVIRRKRLQDEMKKSGFDVIVTYSSENESQSSRYLVGFWPFFDFASVIVPVEGEEVLVTGGPESYEFAKDFSRASKIAINSKLVETSAPEWVPKVEEKSFSELIIEACGKKPESIGICNYNIFPHTIYNEIAESFPSARITRADDVLLKVQAIKSEREIPLIREAYRITEEAMKTALNSVKPGMSEWELEAIARSKMLELGAEGFSYPAWVCSGPNTRLSLCRSTNRIINENEPVQFTFGAKYSGYCGNMCRPFVFGNPPENFRKLMEVALEAMNNALENIKPGIRANEVFKGYYDILHKYGFEEFTLYGPAHGTGSSEVEGLWLSENAEFTIQKKMVFNVDIWLTDGVYGLRYEDGILVTDDGIEELTSYRREIIIL